MAIKTPYSRNAPVGPMYRLGLRGSTITAVTGCLYPGTMTSAIYQFQWTSPNSVAIVSAVEFYFTTATVFTTAQPLQFGLYNIRGYTVPCSGGTVATFATIQGYQTGALDSRFAQTYFVTGGAINIANSQATGFTNGTGRVDQYPSRIWDGIGCATLGVSDGQMGAGGFFQSGYAPNTQSLFFRQNEGFIIAPMITLGAGGGLQITCVVEWAEMGAQYY